jgi:hypothetical protein
VAKKNIKMIKTLNIEIGEEKKPRKRYVRSLEYELIASLAMQKYSSKGGAAHEDCFPFR